MIGFGFLAYTAYKDKSYIITIAFVMLVVLFQPFEKIVLGRTLWNVVDIIAGFGLIISLFFKSKNKN